MLSRLRNIRGWRLVNWSSIGSSWWAKSHSQRMHPPYRVLMWSVARQWRQIPGQENQHRSLSRAAWHPLLSSPRRGTQAIASAGARRQTPVSTLSTRPMLTASTSRAAKCRPPASRASTSRRSRCWSSPTSNIYICRIQQQSESIKGLLMASPDRRTARKLFRAPHLTICDHNPIRWRLAIEEAALAINSTKLWTVTTPPSNSTQCLHRGRRLSPNKLL